MNFFDFIRSVPDVVWSGLLASGLTLGGVLISNRSNKSRLEMQLNHDATIKSQERTASLRRDVYLDAAKKMPKALSSLIEPSDRDESFTVSPGLSDFFSVAAQIQLVAEPVTASLVGELVSKYNDLLMKSAFSRALLGKAISDRNGWERKCERAVSESERVLIELNRLKEVPPSDSKMIDAVMGAYERYFTEAEEARLALNGAETRVRVERLNLLKSLLPNVKDIAEFQVSVLIGIRNDLGLTSDVELLELQAKKELTIMENTISSLEEWVDLYSGDKF
ncbi:MAG: hypothetical protein ACRES5_22700 [Pseudomonas sp.]